MADTDVPEKTGDPQAPLWSAPQIITPKSGDTVAPGFPIRGYTGYNASTWRVQFFHNGVMVDEMRKSADGEYVYINAPFNIIPPGAEFNFRLDYFMGVAWSGWANSGKLLMNNSLQPPLIDEPKDFSQHAAGSLNVTGSCKPSATVTVYDFFGTKIGVATVQGTSWQFRHVFSRGMQFIRVGQKVGIEDSGPGNLRSFTVVNAPPAPTMEYPLEGRTYRQFLIPVSGTCQQNATVEILTFSGTSLGFARVQQQPGGRPSTWGFSHPWTSGTHQIIARQIMGGVPSALTDVRTFNVEL